MIKLLRNAHVFSPAPLGKQDILIVGDKVCRISADLAGYSALPEASVYDLSGKMVVPGYLDLHAHITGGGGEMGPASRVPESQLSDFTTAGVSTVVGLLGTDGVTRSLENLIAKARALTHEGITAYALTSFYGYPPVTMTGSVERDLVLVTPVIGAKLAISDHRSSNPSGEELARLAASCRRGGLLSGTPGLLMLHMGAGRDGLDPVFYLLDHTDIPAKNILPTHVQRTEHLMAQGAELVRRGGYVDFTAGCTPLEMEETTDKLLAFLRRDGVSPQRVTLSSDAFGSQPRFDSAGVCIGLTYTTPKYLHQTMQGLVRRGLALEDALKPLTSAPASLLGKAGVKGCVREGADADLLVLDSQLQIESLFVRGREALWQGAPRLRGTFEQAT